MQLSPAEDAEAPRSQTDRTRQVWIDFARGIGVILVVYGHVLGGLIPPHLFPDGPVAQWMSYTLYTFHMPLFFFLAGLNVQHSLTRGVRPFLASKAWTIAYPYVLWSLIQGSVIMLISSNANIPITTSDLAAIWYRPMAQFWFLYALMICHVLAVLIPNRIIMIAVALAGLIVFMLLPIRPDLALTMHHLPFYVAGLYATRIVMAWQPRGRTGWTMLTVIATAFTAAVAVGGQLSGFDANGIASLPACILGITSVVLLCKLLDETRHRWLALVGVMSMTIYVLHIMAGSGTRIIMQMLHVPPMPWIYLLAGTAAGVILPMIAHVVLQRLNLLAPLGLASLPRRKPAPAPLVSQAARSD
ncbi:acyltransferase family protein [Tardiphaga sp. 172_B4_N1_3]|uniref:acyltransferase family protein n=1 Tax=Tardiphaga sp. 172_B4_N1_3 TaxID=3240787 RepID=UPI003F890798